MKPWSTEEIDIIKNEYAFHSLDYICNRIPNRTRKAITIKACYLNIKQSENYYRQNDCSELLKENPVSGYWLGFLLADGHFSKDCRIQLRLANKDKNHIEKFACFVKCKNIHYYSYGTSVAVRDKKYIKELIHKFNIKRNKTYNPPNITLQNNDYYWSMIIGFIDGDGCIRLNHYKNSYILRIKLHNSWIKFLNKIVTLLNNRLKIKIKKAKIDSNGYALLCITNHKAITFLKTIAMKLDLPFMTRKWDKVDNKSHNKQNKGF
jgi:hypothetical protein